MDLELRDVSKLLNISEDILINWSKEGKIPSYSINNSVRFNKEEIETWMLRQIVDKNSLLHAAASLDSEQEGFKHFNLFRAVYKGDIYHDIEAQTKEEVIKKTIARIAPRIDADTEIVTELFLNREKLVSTAIGNGFAIPHARDVIKHNGSDSVFIVFLKKPIPFDALDGKFVDTLFFLLAATEKNHLSLLSKIAHILNTTELIELLKSHPRKEELLLAIRDWELQLRRR